MGQVSIQTAVAVTGEKLSELLSRCALTLVSDCGGRGTCQKCRIDIAPVDDDLADEFFSGHRVSLHSIRSAYPFRSVLACQTAVTENLLVLLPNEFLSDEKGTGQILLETRLTDRYALSADKPLSGRFGLAIDLGTTTLAAAAVDLKTGETLARTAVKNPQIAFGADVVSRIERASRSPESLRMLQRAAACGINGLITRLTETSGFSSSGVERVTVAGNTVMEYLLLGLDPTPIGRAPFVPPTTRFEPVSAKSLELDLPPDTPISLFPILTGFIGGDLVAGVIALDRMRYRSFFSGPELLLDIGTNGEILLLNGRKILAASTAAGPVFEGAHIRFGMFAADGAIEGVDFAPVPYWEKSLFGRIVQRSFVQRSIKTIGDRRAIGLCGSGLVDAAAELLRLELLTPNGRMATAAGALGKKERGRLGLFENQRAFLLAAQSGLAPAVWLTQKDIRQVQLAVGALRGGVRMLLEKAGLDISQIRHIRLAGGFGNYLNRENAQRIGLLPPEIPAKRISYCGNTSLSGAIAALVKPSLLSRAVRLQRRCEHLELAGLPEFQQVFAESMIFPKPTP